MANNEEYVKLSNNPEAIKLLEDCVNKGLSDRKTQATLHHEIGYKWSLETIRRQRRNLGTKRTHGINNQTPVNDRPSLSVPPPGLNELEKSDWFRRQFKKSHLYATLQTQLTEPEIVIYLEEYGNICCQFEDIVFSEFFQIDDFLKHRILINRQLTVMKSLENEIEVINKWLTKNVLKDSMSKDERMFYLNQQKNADNKRYDLLKANERYDKLVAERQKISQNLVATRKDRIEELRGGKESFMNLIVLLQNSSEERNRQGKYAELTKLAAEDIKKNLRKPVEFPDGTIEPVIIDAETEFEDQDLDYSADE